MRVRATRVLGSDVSGAQHLRPPVSTYARQWLRSLHANAKQQARDQVDEVFRLTRTMLESRLRALLGEAKTQRWT